METFTHFTTDSFDGTYWLGRMKKTTVTIKDVANHAGVSQATASRALSGGGYASHETKRRVEEAAKELGYKPSGPARSLKLQRTDTIGLMITDVVNPFYAYLASGVLEKANDLGFHVILCATDEEPEMEREYLEVLMEKRVDGIVAVSTGQNLDLWQEAIDLGTEVVLVDREMEEKLDVNVVLVDNVKGAYDAVSYLLKLGHRRIGIINGPLTTTTGFDRLQGYKQAFAQYGVPLDEALIENVSFKGESGTDMADRLLDLPDPPTAIFVANNVLGEAMLFVLRERGLRVPDDISLVVFDDVPWVSLVSPALTAVSQPTRELGIASMELLAQSLEAHTSVENSLYRKIIYKPNLILRDSCRPLTE
ncbi:MAG: LacI family DNA-binding transcriptional regulator [Chloroflexota bacterium]